MSTPTFLRAYQAWEAGATTPPPANPYMILGYVLLVCMNFTTTYNHPSLRYLRLLMGAAAVGSLITFASWSWTAQPGTYTNRCTFLGMSMVCVYGILKVLEIAVVGFWNSPQDWPKWVSKTELDEKTGRRKVIPVGPTLQDKIRYSLDIMTASGASSISGRVWDFAPAELIDYRGPSSKFAYLQHCLQLFVKVYLFEDLLVCIQSLQQWDTRNPRPVTSMESYPLQMFWAIILCLSTYNSILIPVPLYSLSFVLAGAALDCWPPTFDRPFASTSLAQFWGRKWHTIFRRPNNEIARGIMAAFSVKSHWLRVHPRMVKFLRACIIFGLTCVAHLALIRILPTDDDHPHPHFFEIQALKFFMLQPIGILLELLVVNPLTEQLPATPRREARRLFAWVYLVWTGRYWSDVWISRGLWGKQGRRVMISPIWKVLRGTWVVP